jgi:ABC-type multidrug transport system fused ATPase/permease subunit
LEIDVTTDLTLIEKREELKRKLATGEYKTLVDVFLDWFERLLRKVTRRKEPLPLWSTSITLVLIFSFLGFSVTNLTGDFIALPGILNQFGVAGNFLVFSLLAGQAIVSAIAINQFIGDIFSFLRDKILDSIESIKSLDNLIDWLEMTCNKRQHFAITIIGGCLAGLYAKWTLNIYLTSSIGYGLTFTLIVFSIFSTTFIDLLYMVLLLSGKFRQYDLILFSPDPNSSELISRLSNKLNLVVFFVGAYGAVMTLIFTGIGLLTFASIVLVLGLWLPIVALFILNQTSLASIIRRAKWKTLNEIQSQVEELRATNNLKDKETIEAINRLMDFHDRVKATRNSAIDSNTILNFINSLLLPLFAFLLGNFDKVLLLFSRKP